MFKGNSLNLSTFLTPAALSLVLAETAEASATAGFTPVPLPLVLAEFLGFEGLLGRMEH